MSATNSREIEEVAVCFNAKHTTHTPVEIIGANRVDKWDHQKSHKLILNPRDMDQWVEQQRPGHENQSKFDFLRLFCLKSNYRI